MWKFTSNAIASIGLKKNSVQSGGACPECSDDEVCSNASREEGLECPICWESFNIVENIPYVLWCGHTLCKNCVLGLQLAVLKFPTQQVTVPFFISCPWCHFLSFRLVYKGNLKFPRKNFLLLWMVESLNGDRLKFNSAVSGENQPTWSPRCNFARGNQAPNGNLRRVPPRSPVHWASVNDNDRRNVESHQFSLHKSLDLFIHFTSKFPFVIVFLLIAFCIVPGCAVILALYLLVTVVFAVPSFLVLYFSYPTLERLVREITS